MLHRTSIFAVLLIRSSYPFNIIGRPALHTLFTSAYRFTPKTCRQILFASSTSSGADSQLPVVKRCELKISELLSPVKCLVRGNNDDPNGSHIVIEVVSDKFQGKTTMQRQQMVYKAIWDEMSSGAVHAVDAIYAKTPAEVQS